MDVEQIRLSVQECTERGLFNASKWAAELLAALPEEVLDAAEDMPPIADQDKMDFGPIEEGSKSSNSRNEDLKYTLARTMFESKEYARVAYTLREFKSPRSQFLTYYSTFLAGERNALDEWHARDSKQKMKSSSLVNDEQAELLSALANATDPYLLFLKALLLHRASRDHEAIEAIINSLKLRPWNWSAWLLLSSCLSDEAELHSILVLLPFPSTHPLITLFQIFVLNELQQPTEHELSRVSSLLKALPNWGWLAAQRALVLYHLRDFGSANAQFEALLSKDPYRATNIDVYSNILYVTDSRARLSVLAHRFLRVAPDTPEVCVLVGNHYALRAEREKAVRWFGKAVRLDRHCLAGWTLMGHEYVEMKNAQAAVDAYRRAIDVNKKDYRAWYGLGQAYELLNMPAYALHYYQRATALRPYDVRMWTAMGICYEDLTKFRAAAECYRRALIGAERDDLGLHRKMVNCYKQLGEAHDAAAWELRVYQICKEQQLQPSEYARSAQYVTEYHLHLHTAARDLPLARALIEEIAGSNAEERTWAQQRLRELNAGMHDKPPPPPGIPPPGVPTPATPTTEQAAAPLHVNKLAS